MKKLWPMLPTLLGVSTVFAPAQAQNQGLRSFEGFDTSPLADAGAAPTASGAAERSETFGEISGAGLMPFS